MCFTPPFSYVYTSMQIYKCPSQVSPTSYRPFLYRESRVIFPQFPLLLFTKPYIGQFDAYKFLHLQKRPSYRRCHPPVYHRASLVETERFYNISFALWEANQRSELALPCSIPFLYFRFNFPSSFPPSVLISISFPRLPFYCEVKSCSFLPRCITTLTL